MFLVESAVRRNSTPALPALMMSSLPSSSSSSPSPSPPVDYSFYRRGSPPMSTASALDRHTILFSAVTGHTVHFNEHSYAPPARVISAKSCEALKELAQSCGTADSEGSESSSCCSDGPPDCKTKEACKRFKTLSEDMNLLVRNITKEAKALVQAEICSLFLLDKEHSELVAEVFEKNGTSDEYLTEIRMPLSQGIVGQVATTGQMMNVKDVYNHPYFYAKVDERTGFVTRNILCFPIKDSTGGFCVLSPSPSCLTPSLTLRPPFTRGVVFV
uniref:GAF domain-containing protein n=1 Tax=Steinernema glaseri TaxID=37863 RepID=A0A1I8AJN0_9BILA